MSTVCVHGLGYVGLPTAAMLANHGHEVVGYDPSDDVIDRLGNGDVRLEEPGLRAFVGQALQAGNLTVNHDAVAAEFHVICVPTPLTEDKRADLQYVREAGETIAPLLREGDTVILESTVPPGTTTDVLRPILEQGGLTAGEQFSLVHCPETVLPGDIVHELKSNDRIIGGLNGTPESAVRLYQSFVTGEIRTTDATTAEFVKLIQNTYRDVNIAFANEVAKLCYDHGVDSREAIELANSHPRVEILNPGPGVGGHCVPVDPYFLLQEDRESQLITAVRETNDGMADHVIRLLDDVLGSVDGHRVAILGVAYKANVSDARESPGIQLARRLQETRDDVEVSLADPYVDDQTIALVPFDRAVADADVAVIVTDHDEYATLDPADLDGLRQYNVVDTKAVLDRERWEQSGFTVERI